MGRDLSQISHGLTGRYGTMASMSGHRQDADVLVRIPAHWLDGRNLSTNQRPESDGTAGRSVTGSQVDHTDVGQPVEHQLHPERCE